MAAWQQKLDSMFSGLTDAVSRPGARRGGVDRLFGNMLDKLHRPDPETVPEDAPEARASGPEVVAAVGGADSAGPRPALAGFSAVRRYGTVTVEEGEDPYAAMSEADHELEYAE